VPRAGLTTLRVVEEAADVADEIGLPQLTLAAVAGRLGVRLPSLYKHVDGMSALQRLVAIQATTQLGVVLGRAAVGKSGIQAVGAMFHACRTWAKEHPGRYEATVRAPDPDDAEHNAAAESVVRVIFDVLSAYELRGDDVVDAVRALRATLHGFIALEQAGGFGMPVDVNRTFDRIIAGLAETISGWVAPGTASNSHSGP
jgi:AcrR family transcriptional regulator